jgi:hypothetical protein
MQHFVRRSIFEDAFQLKALRRLNAAVINLIRALRTLAGWTGPDSFLPGDVHLRITTNEKVLDGLVCQDWIFKVFSGLLCH